MSSEHQIVWQVIISEVERFGSIKWSNIIAERTRPTGIVNDVEGVSVTDNGTGQEGDIERAGKAGRAGDGELIVPTGGQHIIENLDIEGAVRRLAIVSDNVHNAW